MYRCRFFGIQELVHPETYGKYNGMSWKFLNDSTLRGLDFARELFGPLTVNDWLWGGSFKNSGLRLPSSDVGSDYSAHKRGSAFDLKSKRYSGEEMRTIIRKGIKKELDDRSNSLVSSMLEHINEIELGTKTWLHIARTNRKDFTWIPYK